MRKKLMVLALATLLTLGLVASAGAYFTTQAQTKVLGGTGYVSLRAQVQVNLPRDIQPGYRGVKRFWIHNDGVCPMRVSGQIVNLPWYLRASISPDFIPNMNQCDKRWITLTVWMPTSIGNPAQSKSVSFLVKFFGRNNY